MRPRWQVHAVFPSADTTQAVEADEILWRERHGTDRGFVVVGDALTGSSAALDSLTGDVLGEGPPADLLRECYGAQFLGKLRAHLKEDRLPLREPGKGWPDEEVAA